MEKLILILILLAALATGAYYAAAPQLAMYQAQAAQAEAAQAQADVALASLHLAEMATGAALISNAALTCALALIAVGAAAALAVTAVYIVRNQYQQQLGGGYTHETQVLQRAVSRHLLDVPGSDGADFLYPARAGRRAGGDSYVGVHPVRYSIDRTGRE